MAVKATPPKVLSFGAAALACIVLSVLPVSAAPETAGAECTSCHAKIKKPTKSVHAALDGGCETCHQAVEGKAHPKEKGSIKLTAKGAELCSSCHESFKGKHVHAPVKEGECVACHNPHASDAPKLLTSAIPELCVTCHADKAVDGKAVTQHEPFAAGDCTTCHVPHAGDGPGLLKAVKAATPAPAAQAKAGATAKAAAPVAAVNALCFTCHEEEGYATHPVARHPTSGKPDASRPGKELSCVSCHDPHQSKHKRLFYRSDSTMAMCVECHGKGKKPIR